jgi:hypothetical protein
MGRRRETVLAKRDASICCIAIEPAATRGGLLEFGRWIAISHGRRRSISAMQSSVSRRKRRRNEPGVRRKTLFGDAPILEGPGTHVNVP